MFNLKNKNHTQADSVRFSLHVLGVAILLMAFSLVFTNCSFLEDDGFFNKVENEVAVANADKMNVYIRHASIKFGKTQPADAALYQIKNNVEFSVTAMINEEYAFYRWAAFSTADFDITKQQMSMIYVNDEAYYSGFGAKELDSSVVKFENPRSETTKVRVMQTRNDIWLLPVVAERPKIKGTYPKTSQTPVRNSKLRVQFSKPMDETTFEGNFIISQGTYAADFSINETDITDKFQVEINESKNLATFSFRDAAEMFAPGVIIKLYFTEDIADSTGYTMQGSSSTRELEWSIGASVDTLPPLIIAMTAGTGNDCSKFSSTSTKEAERANSNIDNSLYDDNGVIFDKFKLNDKNEQIKDAGGDITLKHRVRDKVNIFVYSQDIAKADGERLESDVLMLGFRAKALTDLSGNALDSTQPGNFVADKIETYAGGENYSEISGKSFKAITGSSGGCIYTYDLSSLPDGLIQIQVYAYDATGNDGLSAYDPDLDDADGYGNGPRSLFIIKDTKAPDIATELGKIKSKSAAAPFGWYNKRSIDTIEVYDETANPIQDYGHPKLAAFHDDIKWVFNMGEGTEWNIPSTDPAWVSIKDKYKIGSASVETDGPVSITFRLMDDLGNISEAAGISSVLYDNTIPVSGEALCSDSSGNATLNSSATTKLTQYVKVPFTEELAGIKIIGITVTGPDGSPVTVTGPDGTQIPAEFNGASIEYAEGESVELKSIELDSDYDGTSEGGKQNFKNITDQYSSTVFDESVERLHVLKESYKTGTFYIKGLNLGEAEGIYTVTVTLYDAALNKAAEKQVKFSHDTKAPVLDSVVVQNVVGRTVYSSGAVDYWLPKAAYDTAKEVKFASLEVTATENGSGIKKITLGQNAFVTSESTVSVGGSVVEASVNTEDNSISFSDYNNPVLYKTSGAITFVITGVRLDNPDSAGGNKISVELTDFVDNTGSNRDSSENFILHPNSASGSPIYAVYSDSSSPAIVAESPAPAIADGKADSASDESTYAAARLASSFTDQAKVDLTLKLSPENYGSGVNVFTLTNGVFTAETKVFVGTSEIPASDYSLDGAKISFINYVFTGANEFKFTSVELQSPDGSQSIGITATDFTGWSSDEVSTNSIVLDRQAPVPGTLDWSVKEGVFGVAKTNVVSNLAMILPFTESNSGVKVIKASVSQAEGASYNAVFSDSNLKVWYVSDTESITSAFFETASNVAFTRSSDSSYITLTSPATSGYFVFLNLKVSEPADFVDNEEYTFSMHLTDSALNGSESDATLALKSDKTAPEIKDIFINRLVAQVKYDDTSETKTYWVHRSAFSRFGYNPDKLDLYLTIKEKASGVEKITLSGSASLTSSSVISLGERSLVKDTDYTLDSTGKIITLTNFSEPVLKENNDANENTFTVKISCVTLSPSSTSTGECSLSVELSDFALNTDATLSKSNQISAGIKEELAPESGAAKVTELYVDKTDPELLFNGGTMLWDRGGETGTEDAANKTEAQSGFTNERLVTLVMSSCNLSGAESGYAAFVLHDGAKFTDSTKIYCYNSKSSSNKTVTDASNANEYKDKTDTTEITGISFSDDYKTLYLPKVYAYNSVCVFTVTNVELTGDGDGSKTVYVYPVDLAGWCYNDTSSGSYTKMSGTITLDTAKPVWAEKPFEPGSGNDSTWIYPHSSSDKLIKFDDEIYFYKNSSSSNTYLTAKYTEDNLDKIYYYYLNDTSSAFAADYKSSAYLVKNHYSNVSDFANNAYANGKSFIFVLIDKAGNISDETQIVRCVNDSGVETEFMQGSTKKALQFHMKYVDDYDSETEGENGSYKVFETDTPVGNFKLVASSSVGGVMADDACHGYPVYYNNHRSGTRGAKVLIDLTGYLEKKYTKTQSGIAYYGVNADPDTLPSGTGSDGDWNKWIPYDSTKDTIAIYPPKANTDAGCMRLWLKDNVGNTQSVRVKNGKEATDEWDVWLYDSADAVTPKVNLNQLPNIGYESVVPEGLYLNADGTMPKYSGSPLVLDSDTGANRMLYTDNARFRSSCTMQRDANINSCIVDTSKTINSSYYGVRVILYPSTSRTAPDRETALQYFSDNPASIKYFGTGGGSIDITDVPFPKYETSSDYFYIHVLCQDAVGNLKTELLKFGIHPSNYSSQWANYARFKYDNKAPTVKVGGTDLTLSLDGNGGSYNGTFTNSQENFEKLCPTNAGHRVYYDATKGSKGTVYYASIAKESIDTTVPYNPAVGENTTRNTDGINTEYTQRRPYFNIDINEPDLFAFYYGSNYGHWDENPNNGHIRDYKQSDFNNWGIRTLANWGTADYWMVLYAGQHDEGWIFDGKVNVALHSDLKTDTICLHLFDKVGHMVDIPMGEKGTKWQNDTIAPSAYFNGTSSSIKGGLNDEAGLYRMDAKDSSKLTVTFSALALDSISSGAIKVYIPKDVASDSDSGIWGYSWDKDIDKIKTDSDGKPYLEFEGSSSLAISSAKTFYIFDNVGNYTACTLTSSIDDITPEITMKFGKYSSYTSGKIYDVANNSLYDCSDSSAVQLSAGPFGGRTYGVNSKENPYVIYSNASTSSSGTQGYILGSFRAKDQTRNDAPGYTTYQGTITQVLVKTYIITSAGVSATFIDATPYLPNMQTEGDESFLDMPIYLDGAGNSSTDPSVTTPSNYIGKLYEITIKDTGGNATTVWLKVLRDREGPSVTPLEVEALTGRIGYQTASSTKNRYYNKIGISFTPSDSGVGSDKYSILGGTSATTVLNVGGNSENDLTDDGTAVSLTSDDIADLSSDKLAIKAYDKLGNASVTYLDGSTSASSSFTWIKDTQAPTTCSFTEKDSLKEGKKIGYLKNIDGTPTLFFLIQSTLAGGTSTTKDENITFEVSATDNKALRGFYVTNSSVGLDSSIPADFTEPVSGKATLSLKPEDYIGVNNTGEVKVWAFDYAGNKSSVTLKISGDNNATSIGQATDSSEGIVKKVGSDNDWYYKTGSKLIFDIVNNYSPIVEYGLAYQKNDGNWEFISLSTSGEKIEKNVTKTIEWEIPAAYNSLNQLNAYATGENGVWQPAHLGYILLNRDDDKPEITSAKLKSGTLVCEGAILTLGSEIDPSKTYSTNAAGFAIELAFSDSGVGIDESDSACVTGAAKNSESGNWLASSSDGKIAVTVKDKLGNSEEFKIEAEIDETAPVISGMTLTGSSVNVYENGSGSNELYYNNAAVYISNVTSNDSAAVFAITTESDLESLSIENWYSAGEDLKLNGINGSDIYLAAKDLFGNKSLTSFADIKIKIADSEYTGVVNYYFDTENPAAPTVVLTNSDLSGNGAYFVETNAEGHEATLYFNTTLLGSAEISFTPSSADTGLAGFFVTHDTTDKSYTALSVSDPVTVDLSKSTARIYAVDKAGNISSPYTVTLKPDTVAAKTLEQITGDSGFEGSIYLVSSYGGSIIYYESGLKLKVNLEANESPITSYALVVGGSAATTAPDDSSAWNPISVAASDGKTAVALTLPEITELRKDCALWVKDAVGNTKAYSNPSASGNPNGLGDPKNLRGRGALKDTWWHLYDSSAFTLTNSMGEKTLTLSGFSTHLPVKSLKFSGFILGDDNMQISKVPLNPDGSKEITISNKSISKTAEGVYELSLGSAWAFDDLKITFDKGNFYFAEGAKVTFVTVKDEEVECSLTPSVTSPTYSYNETDFELTVSGLMPQYKMNNFILTGLSFEDGTEDANKAIDSITIVKGETETAATSYNFTVGEDGTYTIQFSDGCNADSLKIKFKAGQTLADSLSVTMKRWTDAEAVTLPLAAASDPAPSIFGGFFDRVSSGFSSIFTGRSMTHEERMALKEAKAAKKAALAAEKAAKKAAKKAARDAKKNAELASAEQGESWNGLSGEFDSASSELDSAVSKMNSNASQTASQAQVSYKKNVLKVKKTGVKSSESASAAEMSSKESASGNRLIYILAAFASLAVCGGAATVLVKKMRRK